MCVFALFCYCLGLTKRKKLINFLCVFPFNFSYWISNFFISFFIPKNIKNIDDTWGDLQRHQECRRREKEALNHNTIDVHRAVQRRWTNENHFDYKNIVFKIWELLTKVFFIISLLYKLEICLRVQSERERRFMLVLTNGGLL